MLSHGAHPPRLDFSMQYNTAALNKLNITSATTDRYSMQIFCQRQVDGPDKACGAIFVTNFFAFLCVWTAIPSCSTNNSTAFCCKFWEIWCHSMASWTRWNSRWRPATSLCLITTDTNVSFEKLCVSRLPRRTEAPPCTWRLIQNFVSVQSFWLRKRLMSM